MGFFLAAPSVKAAGEIGLLYVAEPLDACSDLTNKPEQSSNGTSPFVLIVRGGCSFEDKVRKAQRAGFKAAIIHDNEDRGILVASNNDNNHNLQPFLSVMCLVFNVLSFSNQWQVTREV